MPKKMVITWALLLVSFTSIINRLLIKLMYKFFVSFTFFRAERRHHYRRCRFLRKRPVCQQFFLRRATVLQLPHYRWWAANCWPMLVLYGLWAEIYRVIIAMTRGLGSQGPPHLVFISILRKCISILRKGLLSYKHTEKMC